MADFGAPVAGNVPYNPTQGLSTLSSLYNIEQAKAVAQQQMQTAKQRQGIAAFMQHFDPEKHIAPDGTLDLNSVLSDPKLRQAAGDQYPQLVQQMIQVKSQQLGAKQQLVNLNDTTRTQFQQLMGGLRTDPDVVKGNAEGQKKVESAIGAFAATGPDAARIAQIYSIPLSNTPPDKLAQALSNYQLQAESASAQAAAQAPAYTSTGSELVNVAPQSAGGNLTNAPNLKVGIPPSHQPFTDSFGRVYTFNQQTGNYEPAQTQAPPPVAGAPQAAPAAPGAAFPGQVQNVATQATADQQAYSNALKGGNVGPQTKNILNNIQRLAGETITGPGSEYLADAETMLGQYVPGMQGATDAATKRQMLGKYVEQLAIQYASQAGYTTDAARDLVAHAIPNPANMTPQAMKDAARFIVSQQQIAQARSSFANNYFATHGNNSTGYQTAESTFMRNIDPRMFDFIGLDRSAQEKKLKDMFGNNVTAEKHFLQSAAWIRANGGFDYATQGNGQ